MFPMVRRYILLYLYARNISFMHSFIKSAVLFFIILFFPVTIEIIVIFEIIQRLFPFGYLLI